MTTETNAVNPPRFVFLATAMVSATAISYEILLMRLLSIVQWHHFAYMIISLALLGYAASGTAIALVRRYLVNHIATGFALCSLLSGISMVVCFIVGQQIPFNALEVVWNPSQLLYLLGLYLLFFVPFFFAACCTGLVLTCLKTHINRLYFFDLLGAGTGALLILGCLFILSLQHAMVLVVVVTLCASLLVSSTLAGPVRAILIAIQGISLVALLCLPASGWLDLRLSPYKGLRQALQVHQSRVLVERSNPLGLISVVESPGVPFREAPGLSLNASASPPEQLAVFTDGDAMSVITRQERDTDSLEYMNYMLSALPYEMVSHPSVAILGAGGGSDVLLALRHDAGDIDVVEINPLMTQLLTEDYADYAGHLYRDDRVTLHHAEARGFIAGQTKQYDLMQLSLTDAFSTSGSGVQSLNESYLYTTEAIEEYLGHLAPAGLLVISRWLRNPPRDTLKLLATLIQALRKTGIEDPGSQIAVLRSWNVALLMVKKTPFSDQDIATIQRFSRARSFDTAYFPGMLAEDANRYNILSAPYLYEGTKKLLGENSAGYIERYKFDITPATDDQPYFFHFFKWRSLPELLALDRHGGATMIEWAYLILLATLVQALIAGVVFVLIPLYATRQSWPAGVTRRMGGYFFTLGLAFMFMEMSFIQKLVLFLGHPLYSIAVVLSGFLVFAGLGSRFSRRYSPAQNGDVKRVMPLVIGAILAITLLYLAMLPGLFDRFIGLQDIFKIAISLAIIAPLAFFMGMPFPLGLSSLGVNAEAFIPWAWGINGFASVVSTSLATLLAIEFGFTMVVLLSLMLYTTAAMLLNFGQHTAA